MMHMIRNILSSRSVWIALAVIFVLNFIVGMFNWKHDFTKDKRYSISDNTKTILEGVEQPIFAEILLAGDFDKGPARLQQATEDLLRSFQEINGKIRYEYNDPFDGSQEQILQNQKELDALGIRQTSFQLPDGEAMRARPAYAYVIFFKGDYRIPVEIIEEQKIGEDFESTFNESIALLEYKFATALKRLERGRRPLVYFTQGHDELVPMETYDYARSASQFFQLGNLNLDSTDVIDPQIDVLVVAKPLKPYSEVDLYKLDQYVMGGGKIVWMIDQLAVQLDSLRSNDGSFVPKDLELGLDPLFFKYGFKMNKSLVVDVESTRVPLVVADQGGKPKMELLPYYYHLIPNPNEEHVIGTKLDRVNLLYAGSIDTLKTREPLDRTVLLQSGLNSFEQNYPMTLNFEVQALQTEFEKFDNGGKIMGLLQEGTFTSYFANRPVPISGQTTIKSSEPTSMVIISDGDLIKNRFQTDRNGRQSPVPAGLNRWEKYKFDNKAFFDNVISYMLGEGSVLEARKKNVELRLLDQAKIQVEKSKWQWFNIGLPLLLLAIFGIINGYIRKRKYAS